MFECKEEHDKTQLDSLDTVASNCVIFWFPKNADWLTKKQLGEHFLECVDILSKTIYLKRRV